MIWFGKVRIACLTQIWKHQDSSGYCYQGGKEDRSVMPVGIPWLLLLLVDQGTWNQTVNTAATTRAYCEIPGDIGFRIKIEVPVLPLIGPTRSRALGLEGCQHGGILSVNNHILRKISDCRR